jgi:hypothetical protein
MSDFTVKMVKLEDLMKKWEQQEVEYSSRLENEQQARASAENQLVDATEKITRLTNKVDVRMCVYK